MVESRQKGEMLASGGLHSHHHRHHHHHHHHHHMAGETRAMQCDLRPRAIIVFFSSRLLRCGPRIAVQILLLLLGFVCVLRLLAGTSIPDIGDAYTSYGGMWKWPLQSGDEHLKKAGGSGGEGGGLRIVVFGSPDVASPSLQRTKRLGVGTVWEDKSWTEYLCEELNCTTHLSFVPEATLPAASFLDNAIYEKTLRYRLDQPFAPDQPAYDYTFLERQYPPSGAGGTPQLPDLAAQVAAFLALPAPVRPPKETLWVFSFGTWDVWSLAAFPTDEADRAVAAMTRSLFAQVEVLYQQSLVQGSVAFSDYWLYTNNSLLEMLNDPARAGQVRPDQRENFRVLLPELFDMSLTPGWHDLRPEPPAPHNKAEQMARAAHLSAQWGKHMWESLSQWRTLPDREVNVTLPPMAVAAPLPRTQPSPPSGLAKYLPFLKAVGHSSSSPPSLPSLVSKVNEVDNDDNDDDEVLVVPFPQRMAGQYNMQDFVAQAMLERQMRDTQTADRNGLGARPENASVYFAEAWRPCIEEATGLSVVLPPGSASSSNSRRRRRGDGDDDDDDTSAREIEPSEGRAAESADVGDGEGLDGMVPSPPAWTLRTCDAPDSHLFYTAFTVGERARREIAHQAVEVIRRQLALIDDEFMRKAALVETPGLAARRAVARRRNEAAAGAARVQRAL